MFDRVEYKKIAKKQLKGRWATPVLATLSFLAVSLIICSPQIVEKIQNSPGTFSFGTGIRLENSIGLIALGIIGIMMLAYTQLFTELWKTRDPLPFSTFLSAFSLWLKGVLAMFWMYLWVFLWTLLFFIPGIVKAYAYSQMFFIIAENPDIGVRRAMKLSIEITRGYKGELFVMDLSFLGWDLLACLTGGLLYLYVMPYMQMSKTNAYKMLKAMAIQAGRVKPEDFGPGEQDEQQDWKQPEEKQPFSGQQGPYTDPVQPKKSGPASTVAGSWDTSAAEDAEAHEAAPDTGSVIHLPPAGDDDSTN